MRTRLRSKVTLLFIVCAALLAVGGTAIAFTADPSGTTATSPTIQSDKADYAPGELVTLSGGNWQPGESVNIKVNDTYGATWSRNVDVTADASGEITDSFNLPNSFVSNYDVTATGAQSGTATTTFTDSNPNKVNVATPRNVSVLQGSSATYGNVTVTMGGNSDPCTVTLGTSTEPAVMQGNTIVQPADTGLPTGATPVFGNSPATSTGANITSTFKVDTTSSTPAGTYTFHVSAAPGSNCQNGSKTEISAEQITLVVTSANSAPTVGNISGDTTANEGQTKSYSVTATDPDNGDTLSYAWSITAGNSFAHIDGSANNSSVSLKFDDGPSSPNVALQVVVDDGHNHAVTKTHSISVNNVAPTVTLSGDASANEGTTHTYTYTVSDPGQDTFSPAATYPKCGTGGNLVGTPTVSPTGGSFPDGPASPTVAIKVADSDGAASNEATKPVTVNNVAPSVSLNGPDTADEGQTKSYTIQVSDPGQDTVSLDSASCDSPKGTVQGTPSVANGLTCLFPDGPATANLSVTVSDGDPGGTNTATKSVTVNNVAPTAAFTAGPTTVDEGSTLR